MLEHSRHAGSGYNGILYIYIYIHIRNFTERIYDKKLYLPVDDTVAGLN